MRSVISFVADGIRPVYLDTNAIKSVEEHTSSPNSSWIVLSEDTLYEVNVPCTVVIEKIAEVVNASAQMGGFVCVSLSD